MAGPSHYFAHMALMEVREEERVVAFIGAYFV